MIRELCGRLMLTFNTTDVRWLRDLQEKCCKAAEKDFLGAGTD